VTGILNPAVLTPEIDSAVLVGFPAAEKYLVWISSTAWAVVFLNVAGFRHVLRRDGQRRELDTGGGGAAGAVGSRRR
jgi:hypothetical protein